MIDNRINELFEAGAHYGYKKMRRHPSVLPFLYGIKNGVDIFDLEKTLKALDEAKARISEVISSGGKILFVGSKNEGKDLLKRTAESVGMPYVHGRWIGGTLTNFKEIRKRVTHMTSLKDKEQSGEFAKYTKKEQLLLKREIEKLDVMFGGIVDMESLPKFLFIIDPLVEVTAMREARQLGIPVIALANTDCNFAEIDYPIPANDASRKTIQLVLDEIASAVNNTAKKEKKAVKKD